MTIARAFCLDQKKSAALSRFTDGNKVSDWAAESVGAVVDAGLMNGKDNGLFDPQANATRAEAVTVLDNAVARLVQAMLRATRWSTLAAWNFQMPW